MSYERAKIFIEEFNQELSLNLSTQEIDELIGKGYTNGKEFVPFKKNYLDKNGQENSYSTMEKAKKKFPLKILAKIVKK